MKSDCNNNIVEQELQTMVTLASALTIFDLGLLMIGNGISKYKFCKETSKKNVKICSSPYVEKTEKRDITEFKIKYRKAIKKFIKTINYKLPHVSLNVFLYNFKKLEIEEKEKYIRKSNKNVVGEYSILNRLITLIKGDKSKSIYHELLHAASSFAYNNVLYTGFKQVFFKNKKSYSIGNGLNEGYTALLDKRYFNQNSSKESYELERKIASILETIFGKELMETLYFRADLYTLTKMMGKYKSEEEILTFYKKLDYLSKHKDKIFWFEVQRRECLNCLEFCGKFLLELFMKSIIDYIDSKTNFDIALEMLKNVYINYGRLLQTKVTISGKEYSILKDKKISKIIDNFIEETKIKTLSKKAD